MTQQEEVNDDVVTATVDDTGSQGAPKAGKFMRVFPNVLTIVRIFMVPFLIYFMLSYQVWASWAALILFLVASYSDHLDGVLARKYGTITNFGKIADPIADKFLMIGAFVTLSYIDYPPWWFTIIVILREVAVTVLRMVLLRKSIVVPASKGGKIKTVTQMFLVFLLLLWRIIGTADPTYTYYYSLLVNVVLLAAFVATVLSGLTYFLDAYDNSRARAHEGDAHEGDAHEGDVHEADAMTDEASAESKPEPAPAPEPPAAPEPVPEPVPQPEPEPMPEPEPASEPAPEPLAAPEPEPAPEPPAEPEPVPEPAPEPEPEPAPEPEPEVRSASLDGPSFDDIIAGKDTTSSKRPRMPRFAKRRAARASHESTEVPAPPEPPAKPEPEAPAPEPPAPQPAPEPEPAPEPPATPEPAPAPEPAPQPKPEPAPEQPAEPKEAPATPRSTRRTFQPRRAMRRKEQRSGAHAGSRLEHQIGQRPREVRDENEA